MPLTLRVVRKLRQICLSLHPYASYKQFKEGVRGTFLAYQGVIRRALLASRASLC